jgi:hypothetical protein
MNIASNEQLVDQPDRRWHNQVRHRLDGLTDDEYVWEPVAGSWTIRPGAECRAEVAHGSGEDVIGYERRSAAHSAARRGLARPCGSAEGPYADFPIAALVFHIDRETIHHGAEVFLLRDLYRGRR